MVMARVVGDITVSLDGFVTGPDPDPEHGLGHGGEDLHSGRSTVTRSTARFSPRPPTRPAWSSWAAAPSTSWTARTAGATRWGTPPLRPRRRRCWW